MQTTIGLLVAQTVITGRTLYLPPDPNVYIRLHRKSPDSIVPESISIQCAPKVFGFDQATRRATTDYAVAVVYEGGECWVRLHSSYRDETALPDTDKSSYEIKTNVLMIWNKLASAIADTQQT